MAYFIDWDKIPQGYDWVAVDQNGFIFGYIQMPIPFKGMGMWLANGSYHQIDTNFKETPNWCELLFHRHESQITY